jgi:hypothetical protein
MNPSSDIVAELNDWLTRLSSEAQQGARSDAAPAAEVELVRCAIAEIKALRERLGLRRTTRSIPPEDLNASNDGGSG